MERLQKGGAIVAGATAAGYISKGLETVSNNKISPKMSAAAVMIIGAIGPLIMGEKKKDGLLTSFCDGVVSVGALKLAGEFKVPGVPRILGTELTDPMGYVHEDYMNGTDTDTALSGTTE